MSRKTDRVRVQVDFVVLFDKPLDSLPNITADDLLDGLAYGLREYNKREKRPGSVAVLPKAHMDFRLDFRRLIPKKARV